MLEVSVSEEKHRNYGQYSGHLQQHPDSPQLLRNTSIDLLLLFLMSVYRSTYSTGIYTSFVIIVLLLLLSPLLLLLLLSISLISPA